MEGTNNVSKDVTYATLSKQSEDLHLITCRINDMAPDGSVTQARA